MTFPSSLLRQLRADFALDWHGIHGAPHWARVRRNGLRLCAATGGNPRVVEAFAFIHDAQRLADGDDPGHGDRAADWVLSLSPAALGLDRAERALLVRACRDHSDGGVRGEITVLCCWDADRLDLGRVGIRPDPRRLCTAAARDPQLIDWAFQRSLR